MGGLFMKKIAAIILCLCFLVLPAIAEDKKIDLQKFKIRYIVTYNELTLEEAGKKEMEIKKLFLGSCDVKVEVDSISSYVISNQGYGRITN